MDIWSTDQYAPWNPYTDSQLQLEYPQQTNSFETKFEADRAMQQRMLANPAPVLLTPQRGCNDELKRGGPVSKARGSESFSGGEIEKQIAEVVTAVGGWFQLFIIILLVLMAVYQYKMWVMINAKLKKED